jgi:hypothetical protein
LSPAKHAHDDDYIIIGPRIGVGMIQVVRHGTPYIYACGHEETVLDRLVCWQCEQIGNVDKTLRGLVRESDREWLQSLGVRADG